MFIKTNTQAMLTAALGYEEQQWQRRDVDSKGKCKNATDNRSTSYQFGEINQATGEVNHGLEYQIRERVMVNLYA